MGKGGFDSRPLALLGWEFFQIGQNLFCNRLGMQDVGEFRFLGGTLCGLEQFLNFPVADDVFFAQRAFSTKVISDLM